MMDTPLTKPVHNQPKTAFNPNYFHPQDIALFKQGSHFELYKKFGAHPLSFNGVSGSYFAVWAPAARAVAVIARIDQGENVLHYTLNPREDNSGIWEGFIPFMAKGSAYNYEIEPDLSVKRLIKIDPFAFRYRQNGETFSLVWDLHYNWHDENWMAKRANNLTLNRPVSIYEVHLGSWRRTKNEEFLSYRALADELVQYVKNMEFTHVEFLPLMEHPFYGSWGYQALGYFAPTERYGKPEELMYLIDRFHQNNIAVILDWVPSHFPCDSHGLAEFDGTRIYERNGFHPDWTSCIFNLGSREVSDFLISSALFWLDKYHIDGLRVDAVSSMLYLDYSKTRGDWSPNFFGGKENIEAIAFIRRLNDTIRARFPEVQVIAEESTIWPKVTRPSAQGGLGYCMKWNMGWMKDTLNTFSDISDESNDNSDYLMKSFSYAFDENYILPVSHDDAVYASGSLLSQMPGDDGEKFS